MTAKRKSSKQPSAARTVKRTKDTEHRAPMRVRASRVGSGTRANKSKTSKGKSHGSKRTSSKNKRTRASNRKLSQVAKRRFRTGFPTRGNISPIFAKYMMPVGYQRHVTYAMATVRYVYIGEGDDEKTKRRTAKVPIAMGYLTKKEVAELTFDDVQDAVENLKGPRAQVLEVHGFVQRKPVKQREHVMFTKKDQARHDRSRKRTDVIKANKARAASDRIRKTTEKANKKLATENALLKAEIKRLQLVTRSNRRARKGRAK